MQNAGVGDHENTPSYLMILPSVILIKFNLSNYLYEVNSRQTDNPFWYREQD